MNVISRHWKRILVAAILLCCSTWGSQLFARSTCWCEIASSYSTGEHDTVIISLTDVVNTTYCAGPGCLCSLVKGDQCDAARADCSRRCNAAADAYRNNPGAFCAKGTGGPTRNGVTIRAYSHVGTRGWESNDTIGTLTNLPAVSKTTCTCPKGWLTPDNVDGGVINGPGKGCKRLACLPITPGAGTSLPPNGSTTPVLADGSTWWTWTNGLWQSAPVANCATTVVSAAVCKF
jgi:hypothetical protein